MNNKDNKHTHRKINKFEELFVATNCIMNNPALDTWLVDNECTIHMIPNVSDFKELDESDKSKVKIDNRDLLDVKGIRAVVLETLKSIQYICDVLFYT